MKVAAINSSPMTGKGNTARILDPFLEGMRGAGAEKGMREMYVQNLNQRFQQALEGVGAREVT